jgi:hypothetical protein
MVTYPYHLITSACPSVLASDGKDGIMSTNPVESPCAVGESTCRVDGAERDQFVM